MIDLLTKRAVRRTRRTGRGASTTTSTSTTSALGPTLPIVAGPPLYLAGGIVGWKVCTDPTEQALWSLLVLATSFGTAWVAWHYADGHRTLQRAHVAVGVAISPLALLVPMVFGVNRWTAGVMLPLWVAYCATWQARVSPAVLFDGDRQAATKGDTIAESLGLTGLTVSRVVAAGTPGARPDRISSRWHVGAPKGYADIARRTEEIRNWAGAHFVRAARVADDPRAADMLVVMRDVLAAPVPYVHDPVATMFDPIRIGTRIDGSPELFTVATSEGFARVLIAGCAGSGKTRTAWVIWAALSRTGAVWWIADPVKGGQSVGPAEGLFSRVETDPDGTADMLSDLRAVIKNRSTLLGTTQAWSPDFRTADGRRLAPLVAWFEEAASTTSDGQMGKELTRIAEACRSVGILLVVSQQRPSGKNMSTDAREQFTTSLCHGTDSVHTKAMVLSDMTVTAGARPEDWSDTAKGYHYAETSGVPRAQWADPCRTMLIGPEQLQAAAASAVTGVLLPEEIAGTTLDHDTPAKERRSGIDDLLDELLGDDDERAVRFSDLLAEHSPDDSSDAARKRLARALKASTRARADGARGWWRITR